MQTDRPRRTAYFWLAWVSLLALSSQQGTPDEDYEIVQVTEFVRHGARTSRHKYLGLPIDHQVPGSLTPIGRAGMYRLGCKVRELYPDIFQNSDLVFKKNMQAYSSAKPRCIESAEAQLMGLMPSDKYPYSLTVDSKSKYALPPFGDTKSEFKSYWRQVSNLIPQISVKSPKTDLIFFPDPSHDCPKASKLVNRFKKKRSEQLRSLWKPVSDQLVSLGFDPKKLINQEEFNLIMLGRIFDEVRAYKYYWGKLPDKISEDLFDRLHKLASIDFSNFYDTEFSIKLWTHEFSHDLLEGFKRAQKKKNHVLFRLFSGHDSTIFALQMAFNRTSHQCLVDKASGKKVKRPCKLMPKFGSNWLFELRRHKQSKQYFVKLLNDGKTVTGLCPSQSADHPYCSYSEFRTLITNNLQFKPNKRMDYLRYCGNPLLLDSVQTKSPTKHRLSSFWSADWWRHI